MVRKPGEMRVQVREDMRGGKGAVTIRHCFEKEEFGANVRLCARLSLPPGASIGMHDHKEEDEVFFLTKGQGLLDEGATRTPVGAGDAILTGKGGAHAIENTGDTDLEILAIIACYAPKKA